MDLKIITLEEQAFYDLVNRLLVELRAKDNTPDKWIDGAEAMQLLRITSKTTLQKVRDEGKIRFSQPMPKHLLYDRESITSYIEKHAKNIF